MKAVHFGAGNIGRGFVGLLLHEAGIEVVFADVQAELISSLQAADSYTVHTVGSSPTDIVVDGFRAVNSAEDVDAVIAEIATADIVTTAVGAHILRFVAPAIARGIAARSADSPRIAVMACENAINATDTLKTEIVAAALKEGLDAQAIASRAVFANTAVDRIVPGQAADAGLDVTVETFYEWAVEAGPFAGDAPEIPGVTWVEDLEPYIERKLFTVNTGHATTAWFGWGAGISKISDAITEPWIRAKVASTLAETANLLVAKHGFSTQQQQAYVSKILERFANPYLPDTVDRVGRAPERKLSRQERIIGPAAQLAERGLDSGSLVEAFGAGLRFFPDGDEEGARIQTLLTGGAADEVTTTITGLEPEHPLYPAIRAVVETRIQELSTS